MAKTIALQTNVPLGSRTTLAVGGSARHGIVAHSAQEVSEALAWASQTTQSTLVFGGGSNMLVADDGFDGLLLEPAMTDLQFTDTKVVAEAGCVWDDVVAAACDRGLSGIEGLSGIPGSVGAAPMQNIGAYGQELADVLDTVTAVDRNSGQIVILPAAELGLDYRHSHLKGRWRDRYVVLSIALRLNRTPSPLRHPQLQERLEQGAGPGAIRQSILAIRRSKSMVYDRADPNHRSAGSFFTNPIVDGQTAADLTHTGMPQFPTSDGRVKLSAAWMIEGAGFSRGYGDGPAGLSSNHCLALINRGNATAADVVELARELRQGVLERFGVTLTPEPVFVGFDQSVDELLGPSR